MRRQPNSLKYLVCFMVCAVILCLITTLFLDRELINHLSPSPASSWNFKYDNLLHFMGYSSLTGWSKKDQAELERFFSSVSLFAISAAERHTFIELLGQFRAFCRQNNITFFLYYGAMLGAFRHHGFTPWDDDLDVLMPLSSKSKFEKLLKNHSVLAYSIKGKFVLPVFLRDDKKSQPIKKHTWRWPYIEVHFYEVKNDKMVHHFEKCGAHKVSDIFPLIEVPFEDMTMPAPRRMDCLVSTCYKNCKTKCCTQWFSHSEERKAQKGRICIDCKLLTSVFPFVSSRYRHGDYVDEQLFLNNTRTWTRMVKKPNCRIK